MKVIVFMIAALLFVFIVGGVGFTAMQEKALIYGGAGQGKVIFDHKTHASKGMVCADCHAAIFDTQKKALFTMEDHSSDKKCFACHNGKKAFNDCAQCHRKF
jgi:phosphate transport system substrate-binding protein